MVATPVPRRAAVGLSAVAVLGVLALVAPRPAAAQEIAHPVHIHAGTCAELGDVVAPLTDLLIPAGERSGPESGVPVSISTTVVEIPLQTIVDGGHAINAHESAEEIDVYIACGDIGGVVVEGRLVIGLDEQNDSGHHGLAILTEDGDATNVEVFLIEDDAALSFDEATPAP